MWQRKKEMIRNILRTTTINRGRHREYLIFHIQNKKRNEKRGRKRWEKLIHVNLYKDKAEFANATSICVFYSIDLQMVLFFMCDKMGIMKTKKHTPTQPLVYSHIFFLINLFFAIFIKINQF